MATDSTRIVVPGLARIYFAPVGTTVPTDLAAPAAAWVDVGHTTEDGTTLSTDPNFEQIRSHQSVYPVRTVKTSDTFRVALVMEEWSRDNFVAAFGGGSVTKTGVAPNEVFTYHPPAAGEIAERAVIVDAVDGSRTYRVIVPRAMPSEGVELELAKAGSANLGVTLDALGADTGDPWYLVTNSTAFAPAA